MSRFQSNRSGFSLTEVLIAIFTLALGLLGIMSLFPMAAANMATAIKDENTAQLNQSATAACRWWWKEETPGPAASLYPDPPPAVPLSHNYYDPFFNAMTNVNFPFNPDLGAAGNIPVASSLPQLALNSPSCYPVYVDPVGWNNANNLPAQTYWVGGNDPLVIASNYMTIPRRSLRRIEYVPTPALPPHQFTTDTNTYYLTNYGLTNYRNVLINRLCFRLDDIGFGKDGTPYGDAGDPLQTSGVLGAAAMDGQIQRDGRYSCGFLVKRRLRSQAREAELTVVVYSGRSVDSPSDENAYQTTFFRGSTEAWLDYPAGQRPKLHRGNWILDATMTLPNGLPDLASSGPHGYFYRIINISDDPNTANRLVLELQTRAYQSTHLADGTSSGPGLGIVMQGVVEVFERGLLSQYTRPAP